MSPYHQIGDLVSWHPKWVPEQEQLGVVIAVRPANPHGLTTTSNRWVYYVLFDSYVSGPMFSDEIYKVGV